MKKLAVIIAALLLSVLPQAVWANVYFTPGIPYYYVGLPPYSCASPVAGFILTPSPGVYRLTGPVYVPVPGYGYSMSPVTFDAANPVDAVATLTLKPPSNTMGPDYLPRLTVVPPLLIDFSFVSAVPVHKLTIYIANPVNRSDTQITCLQTGATQ